MMLSTFTARHPTDQAMVDYLAGVDRFTYADLEQNVRSTEGRRKNLVSRLVRMKLVFEVGREGGCKVWTTKKENVSRTAAKIKRQTIDGQLWSVIRSLDSFTPDEVHTICVDSEASVSLDYVRGYCRNLLKGGFVAVVQKARTGKRPATYKLIKNTGPLPPVVKVLECVIDQNSDRVVYVAGDRL